MKPSGTGSPSKPVLDEGAFQQLLSAAFVLQQHREKLQETHEPESAFARVLTQVVDIQELIRNHRLDLQAATSLVTRRIREMTEASGAAIGILEGNDLEYFAASGSASGEAGSRAPFDLSLTAECLRTGQVLRCPNVEGDARLRPELCAPLGVRALIAVPILFQAKVAGVLELHFAQTSSFHEQDVRTCQLLASLLAEAMGKKKESESAPAVASNPATVAENPAAVDAGSLRAALEKIKPQLERLAGSASTVVAGSPPGPTGQAEPSQPAEVLCTGCGRRMAENESFCAVCGTSRSAPSSQRTWASLWDLQTAAEKSGKLSASEDGDPASAELDVLPSELEDIVSQFSMEPGDVRPAKRSAFPPPAALPADSVVKPASDHGNGVATRVWPSQNAATQFKPAGSSLYSRDADVQEEQAEQEESESLPSFAAQTPRARSSEAWVAASSGTASYPRIGAPGSDGAQWTSAAKTKEWLETEHRSIWLARKWQAQRANIYLAAAAALLIAVLAGLGTPPEPAPIPSSTSARSSKSRPKAPPKPELSLSDKVLVDLGLAEAPPAPAYMGNPDARVWVDLHTALYYCSGSDLYGKTPGGKFTVQSDAQQDNFQPASRRVCD